MAAIGTVTAIAGATKAETAADLVESYAAILQACSTFFVPQPAPLLASLFSAFEYWEQPVWEICERWLDHMQC